MSPAKEAALAIISGYAGTPLKGRTNWSALPDGFGFITQDDLREFHIDLPGTKDHKDICTDLNTEWFHTDNGVVHAGFHAQLERLLPVIKKFLKGHPNTSFHVSGHSEGAAIAYLLTDYIPVKSLIVFGCPNFASNQWCQHFLSKNIPRTSMAGDLDLIPDFPIRAHQPVRPQRIHVSDDPLELAQHSINNMADILQ